MDTLDKLIALLVLPAGAYVSGRWGKVMADPLLFIILALGAILIGWIIR